MVKVCGIVGSPVKNGNVDLLVSQVLAGAQSRGSETIKLYLNDMRIAPCQSCGVDPAPGYCQFDDDMSLIYDALESCDAIVLGSPVYFDSVSAQTKLMIDRCNCLTPYVEKPDGTFGFEKRVLKHKKGVFVAVSGTRQRFRAAQAIAQAFFTWANVELVETILYAHDDNAVGGVQDDEQQMARAFAIGTEILRDRVESTMPKARAAGPEKRWAASWFDPSDDIVIHPKLDRQRWWRRTYGMDQIDVAPQVLFAVNRHGSFFDAVCEAVDPLAVAVHDYRAQGYVHYHTPSGDLFTVYQSPIPAPWAAQALELLISAGAKQIVFLNGAGALRPELSPGSIVLPGELIREEGTSFHYAPPEASLRTSKGLNERLRMVADSLGIVLSEGKHWTTDAIYRETWGKVKRFRDDGVVSVDMELAALAGVAHYRHCELSSLLVITDVLSRSHTWNGTTSTPFRHGVEQAAQIAARIFCTKGGIACSKT